MFTRFMKWMGAVVIACSIPAAVPAFLAAKPVPGGIGRQDAPKPAEAKSGFPNAADETLHFEVDARSKRNEVVFVSKTPKETITGKTKKVVGKLGLNLKTLAEIAGSFEVAWADLDTGNKTRNEHMLSSPWVDAQSHPQIVFTLTAIEPGDEGVKGGKTLKAELVGKMAMNGQEKEMRIPATLAYLPESKSESGAKRRERFAIRAKFSVELADFGIEGRGIGQGVAAAQEISVSLVMTRAKKAADEASADGKPADKGKKGKKKADSET